MPLNPYAREYKPWTAVKLQTQPQQPVKPPIEHLDAAAAAQVAAGAEEVEFDGNELFQDAAPSPRGHCGESAQALPSSPGSPGSSSQHSASEVLGALPPCDLAASPTQAAEEPPGQPSTLPQPAHLSPADFELLRVVGQGAFGKVFQVRKRDTGHIYAMKVMRKARVLERDHGDYVRAEREVLSTVFHPYIVTLRFSFQTASKLYLVLDFVNGGHLFFQLYRQGIFDEPLTRLYTAEIVLAVGALHERGIAHRDLKPENVLLDAEGHIKITDFGLCKDNMQSEGRTNSFIGTMEYMAPEIIAGKGHGKDVDWWSVGVLMYEMLCGVPPFNAKGRGALQKQILSSKLKMPAYVGRSAQSLLRGLLTRDAAKRLGAGAEGAQAVKDHPFFDRIDWGRLEQKQLPSPFKPSIKEQHSVENFDAMWTQQPVLDSPCGTPTNAAAFENFSYMCPSHLLHARRQQPQAD